MVTPATERNSLIIPEAAPANFFRLDFAGTRSELPDTRTLKFRLITPDEPYVQELLRWFALEETLRSLEQYRICKEDIENNFGDIRVYWNCSYPGSPRLSMYCTNSRRRGQSLVKYMDAADAAMPDPYRIAHDATVALNERLSEHWNDLRNTLFREWLHHNRIDSALKEWCADVRNDAAREFGLQEKLAAVHREFAEYIQEHKVNDVREAFLDLPEGDPEDLLYMFTPGQRQVAYERALEHLTATGFFRPTVFFTQSDREALKFPCADSDS